MSWIIPACFVLSCALLAAGIMLLILRGFGNMEAAWLFSIGADLYCMAVCVMLCFSCVLNFKRRNEHTRVFVGLLTTNALALFLDEAAWLVQGIPQLRVFNLTINVLFYMNGVILIYQFWQYIRRVLKMENSLMKAADSILNLLLIPTLMLCVVNFFYPLYFRVDESGVYQRCDKWYISQLYMCVALLIVLLELLMSRASKKDRFVAFSFAIIPLINQLLTRYTFGISTQYAAMLVSIVLIYGVLFAEREKTINSTEKELDVATRIQSDMLPNTFPFLPDRTEFDLFASMTPAKEVGGDFYDFFMVDDDRLALVIADVSGKGIPAALFMMASKIILKNNAMTGKSPAQILTDTNNTICANNQLDMFVTVWLGILEISTGKLTAANAGHEYPVIKSPDGKYELYKDKHGFVVGGMSGIKYREYELTLKSGSRLFLYTDGVPEASNADEELFGNERMLQALNEKPDADTKETLLNVRKNVNDFVMDAEQFDDLTMLCLEYK